MECLLGETDCEELTGILGTICTTNNADNATCQCDRSLNLNGAENKKCEMIESAFISNVTLYSIAILICILIIGYHVPLFKKLSEKRLIVWNASFISMMAAILALPPALASNILFLVVSFYPLNVISLSAFYLLLVSLAICGLTLAILIVAFIDIAQSLKKMQGLRTLRKPVVILISILFVTTIAIACSEVRFYTSYAIAANVFVLVIGLILGPSLLFLKFAVNFRSGKTRRAIWKNYWFLGSIFIMIDIEWQLFRKIVCKRDVAMGRELESGDDKPQSSSATNRKSARFSSMKLNNIVFHPASVGVTVSSSLPAITEANDHERYYATASIEALHDGNGQVTNTTSFYSENDLAPPTSRSIVTRVAFSKKSSEEVIKFLQRVVIFRFFAIIFLFLGLSAAFRYQVERNKCLMNEEEEEDAFCEAPVDLLACVICLQAICHLTLWFLAEPWRDLLRRHSSTTPMDSKGSKNLDSNENNASGSNLKLDKRIQIVKDENGSDFRGKNPDSIIKTSRLVPRMSSESLEPNPELLILDDQNVE